MKNKQSISKNLTLILGVILMFLSVITFVSIFAVGHELSLKNFDTLMVFILVFVFFISGAFLLIFLIKKGVILRKVSIILLILTSFALAYALYEFFDIETESFIDFLSLLIFVTFILNIKVLLDLITKKEGYLW